MGGELSLVVKFPDRQPIVLTGLGENPGPDEGKKKAKKRAKAPAKSKPGTHRAA